MINNNTTENIHIQVTMDGNEKAYALMVSDVSIGDGKTFACELEEQPAGDVEHYFRVIDSENIIPEDNFYSLDTMTRGAVCDMLQKHYGLEFMVLVSIGGQVGYTPLKDFSFGQFKLESPSPEIEA